MNKSDRRGFIFLASCLVIIGLATGLLPATKVKADIGVQPVLPGGSSIKPGEETPIQMESEVVRIDVRAATEADNSLLSLRQEFYGFQWGPVWYPGIANVDAVFLMKNPTDQEVNMTVWFPLASALENVSWNLIPGETVIRIQEFEVSVGGVPTNVMVTELPNPKGSDRPDLPWANFSTTFPGGKVTEIHVKYILPLQPSPKGHEMALYYIFQTGSGWAGSIGQAELILNLPYPAMDGTLAKMKKFNLPPMNIGQISEGVPTDATVEGNQVRWLWKDFEPGPDDDFAVWLLQPVKWQELETGVEEVKNNREDGQAWLTLANGYYSISTIGRNFPSLFSLAYIRPGIQAYQKAAELLPDHPTPHVGLGLFALVPYQREIKAAPPDVIRTVQDELRIAKELETKNPSLVKNESISSWNLEEALSGYFYNDATMTIEAATQVIYNSTLTALATQEYATRTLWASQKATSVACYATAGVECFTPSPTLSLTPEPSRTPVQIPSETPVTANPSLNSVRLWQVVTISACIVSLLILGYLSFKRSLKRRLEK